MAEAHTLFLDAVEQDVLAPDVVDLAIAEALGVLTAPPDTVDAMEETPRALRAVETELRNLTAALAAGGGDLTSVVDAIRTSERRRALIERQLANVARAQVADPIGLERQLRERVAQWREMFHQNIQLARQALQKLLVDKIMCTAKQDADGTYYELRARLSFGFLGNSLSKWYGVPSGNVL